jgi:DNA-binding response OmpR family regulator
MGESRSPAEFSKKPNMVLVVEDDTEMRELLRIELEAEGFTILTATNGAQAVSTARTEQPEVILMDVQMPVMNGVEAAEILKDDHDTRHIPIIMITALERKEDIIKGFEAGAIDYITKPFFLPELKARVNAVLRLKNIYDELIAMREQLIKDEMLNTIKTTTSIIQETIDDNLDIIIGRLNYFHQNQQYPSEKDFNIIENANANIKNTVGNLSFLDSFVFKVYQRISSIVDRIY